MGGKRGIADNDVASPGADDASERIAAADVRTPSRSRNKRVRLNIEEQEDAAAAAAAAAVLTTPSTRVNKSLFAQQPQEAAAAASLGVVTPAVPSAVRRSRRQGYIDDGGGDEDAIATEEPRRELFSVERGGPARVTPAKVESEFMSPAKKKLLFGKYVAADVIPIKENVRKIYHVIRKRTGTIGGNGSQGPIYGELTAGSMQKMINLMKEHTGFCPESRFIDVGSGVGKPNLHVAQDPGVQFSYGIEVEVDRWLLGVTSLFGVLAAAAEQKKLGLEKIPESTRLGHSIIFEHGDIRDAKTFDPFTHVYMFSIGFPPALWVDLAEIWNRSSSPYMICYHSPKDIVRNYQFNVELIAQTMTSMHGSKEGHMGYIYRRISSSISKKSSKSSGEIDQTSGKKRAVVIAKTTDNLQPACDPLFADAWKEVENGLDSLLRHVETTLHQAISLGPSSRVGRRTGTRK